ncbi:hypothetical protein QN277_014730 [Acacia crassicarpa]|uniref:Uncharacterized protein n=1 Tax=Acacia crassicarpa TaxID=499986 RepID=A0AAE1JTK7_9FABA|nr:hypothetical protein QN277_014730 [Acacia crassicarpa]
MKASPKNPSSTTLSQLHICLPSSICLREEDTTEALAPRFIKSLHGTQPQPPEGKELSRRESTRGINGVILSFLNPRKNWLAAQHMKSVSTGLRNYGLQYNVLYHPYFDLDVKEALNRLHREIVDAHKQHLKCAMDLSMKHEYLPENLQVHLHKAFLML